MQRKKTLPLSFKRKQKELQERASKRTVSSMKPIEQYTPPLWQPLKKVKDTDKNKAMSKVGNNRAKRNRNYIQQT